MNECVAVRNIPGLWGGQLTRQWLWVHPHTFINEVLYEARWSSNTSNSGGIICPSTWSHLVTNVFATTLSCGERDLLLPVGRGKMVFITLISPTPVDHWLVCVEDFSDRTSTVQGEQKLINLPVRARIRTYANQIPSLITLRHRSSQYCRRSPNY